MNWDEYKEASHRVISEFGRAYRKLEMDILLDRIDEHGKTARREDIQNLLAKMFHLQDQLEPIVNSPEIMMRILLDILGLKEDKRGELIEKAKKLSDGS